MNEIDYNLNPYKCDACQSTIPYKKGRRKSKLGLKFCNNLCQGVYTETLNKENYYTNPLCCNQCNKIIPYNNRKSNGNLKFCSNLCSNTYYKYKKFTPEVLQTMREKSKLIQPKLWDLTARIAHSKIMKQVVNNHPNSYSSNNICGRVKSIPIIDSLGNTSKCLGNWELLVSKFLTDNNIRWTNTINTVFNYNWNGAVHRYFPDFKLLDYTGVYIEVKGYERERDREKWKQFPDTLIIIKLKEIKEIKNGTFQLNIGCGARESNPVSLSL